MKNIKSEAEIKKFSLAIFPSKNCGISPDFLNSIKSDNRKQLLELEKLEKKLEQQQKLEKKAAVVPFVITNRMYLKFWAFGILVIFLGLFVYTSLSIIYLIFMAYIMSLAMEAIIDFFEKKIHYRGLSIA